MMNRMRTAVAIGAAVLSLISFQACSKDCDCPTSPSTGTTDTTRNNALTPFVWETGSSFVTTPLISVAMSDAQTATAVGGQGTIIRTTDGGATWQQQSSGAGDDLYGISFADRYTGVAVGGNALLRTTNGGASWTFSIWPGGGALRNVQMVTAAIGYAVANVDHGGGNFEGRIYRTQDGGLTWEELPLPPGISGLYGIQFLDPSLGIVTSRTGQILRTTDGGDTWQQQQSGTTTFLHGVFFTSPMVGTVVGGVQGGTVGTILRTTNGGATWTPQSATAANVFLYRVYFSSEKRGMAVGYNGRLLRTNDGGATWVDQSIQTANRIMGLSFLNDSTGIIVGDQGLAQRVKR